MSSAAASFLPNIVPNNILARMPRFSARGDKTAFTPVSVILVLRAEEVQLLAQVAEFENAKARVTGQKIPGRGWSRTALAEAVIAEGCLELAKEMAPVIAEHGPMPVIELAKGKDAEEKERFRKEMERYVRKVVWLEKRITRTPPVKTDDLRIVVQRVAQRAIPRLLKKIRSQSARMSVPTRDLDVPASRPLDGSGQRRGRSRR